MVEKNVLGSRRVLKDLKGVSVLTIVKNDFIAFISL